MMSSQYYFILCKLFVLSIIAFIVNVKVTLVIFDRFIPYRI